MGPQYGVLATALETALRLTRSDDRETLTELLELHAGALPEGGGRWYRPFYTASVWLRANPEHVRVLGGGSDRLEYQPPELAHSTLLEMQKNEDSRLNLVVPPEYAVKPPAAPRRHGSVAVPTQTSWG